MSTFGDTLAGIEAEMSRKVIEATWGHLAPIKGKTYKARVVYAIGCFGNDSLNPMPLVSDFSGLDSSPWFYDALCEFIAGFDNAEGCVYEWIGTLRNYQFTGTRRLLIDANKRR